MNKHAKGFWAMVKKSGKNLLDHCRPCEGFWLTEEYGKVFGIKKL